MLGSCADVGVSFTTDEGGALVETVDVAPAAPDVAVVEEDTGSIEVEETLNSEDLGGEEDQGEEPELPEPSCPLLFDPQHLTLPSSKMAQEYCVDAEIWMVARSVPRSR